MKEGEVINGYKLLMDGTTAGGGMCQWTFAKKGGKEYFLKEFLSPVFPVEGSPGSEKLKEKRRLQCKIFEDHHQKIRKELEGKIGVGGSIVITLDFFRHKSKYYKVTEKIDVSSLSLEDISSLGGHNKMLLLRTVAFSLKQLHNTGIVHGDLKPDNILIKKTEAKTFTSKLIDFDNSYFTGNPPEINDDEDIVGTTTYYSPELLQYVRRSSETKPESLTVKSDIYALGLIFCQYLSGDLPVFSKEKYTYACVASLNGESLSVNAKVTKAELRDLLNKMLETDPARRPDINEIHKALLSISFEDISKSVVSEVKKGTSLKGTLVRKKMSKSRFDGPADEKVITPVPESRLKGSLVKKKV
jgi:serine/threonine protein kinase